MREQFCCIVFPKHGVKIGSSKTGFVWIDLFSSNVVFFVLFFVFWNPVFNLGMFSLRDSDTYDYIICVIISLGNSEDVNLQLCNTEWSQFVSCMQAWNVEGQKAKKGVA